MKKRLLNELNMIIFFEDNFKLTNSIGLKIIEMIDLRY